MMMALALITNLELMWDQADDDGKRKILESVFVKVVVDQQKISDMEARNPYNLILRWKPEEQESRVIKESLLT